MVNYTGFNPDEVVQSIKKMNNIYVELCSLYNKGFKSFIDEISKLWACNEAQTYFRVEFKPIVDNLKDTIELQFSNIINIMNNSAKRWAEASHETFNLEVFPGSIMKEVDVSVIQNRLNGNVGISIDLAVQSVKKFQNNMNTQFNNILNKCILISSGFLGGNQQETLNNKLSLVQKEISKDVTDITQDISNMIKETASKYELNSQIIERSIDG
jgi:hypothetical protein